MNNFGRENPIFKIFEHLFSIVPLCLQIIYFSARSVLFTLYNFNIFAAGVTITSPPTPMVTSVNKTAFLHCHASYSAVYDLTYQWKFNGRLIDYDLHPEFFMVRLIICNVSIL